MAAGAPPDHADRFRLTDRSPWKWGRIAGLRPRGAFDGLIAATGVVHDLILVSRDVGDFDDSALSILIPRTSDEASTDPALVRAPATDRGNPGRPALPSHTMGLTETARAYARASAINPDFAPIRRTNSHDRKPPCPARGGTNRARPPSPPRLEPLVETARAYARAATSRNTNRAYAADWRDYLRWRARQGLEARPLADPECVGLYLAALASGGQGADGRPRTVATIERRLSALAWNFAQRSLPFDRKDRHVATVLAGVRRAHGRPPVQKEALLPEHVIAMLDALPPSDLRNLRDRAILLIGFAGGLRRSEIVGLVMSRETRSRAPAGRSSSTAACSSRCAARPAGARSRSAAARASAPARSPRSRPG